MLGVGTSRALVSTLVLLSLFWFWLSSSWFGAKYRKQTIPHGRNSEGKSLPYDQLSTEGLPQQPMVTPPARKRKNKIVLIKPNNHYVSAWSVFKPCHHECHSTPNQEALPSVAEFDAVVINLPLLMLGGDNLMEYLTMPRSPHQRYVMYSGEAPLQPTGFVYAKYQQPRDFPYYKFNNFFNWTMTYRLDSDFQLPHGHFKLKGWRWSNKKLLTSENLTDWVPYDKDLFKKSLEKSPDWIKDKVGRPGKVAWVTSHCYTRSRRHLYVKELQKYIDVKIFGSCGEKMSGSVEKGTDSFKFYLAFENALCKDYVTEKFFSRVGHILPVVKGNGQWSKAVPPHSYIDAEEFSGPKELAEYLLYLDQNPEEYLSYFWWMEHYTNIFDYAGKMKNAFCHLCSKLHDASEPPKTVNLYEWWYKGSECKDVDYWFPNETTTFEKEKDFLSLL